MNWKIVPSYPAYEVSDTGRVKRLAYQATRKSCNNREFKQNKRAKEQTVYLDRRDNAMTSIVKPPKKNGSPHKVSRLVAEAFIGDVEGMEVHHIDRNPANNGVDNLQVLTPEAHKALHEADADYRRKGASVNTAKLTTEQVIAIKLKLVDYKLNMVAELAEEYDVPFQVISRIRRGLTWKHL